VVQLDALRPALAPRLCAGLCLLLLLLLALRVQPWSDELQLSAAALVSHPQSVRSHYHYANVLLRRAEAAGDAQSLQLGVTRAREQYQQMYQLDPGSAVAAISLYYIDSRYFPALASQEQWLKRLQRIVEESVLTAEDFNAFRLLNSCLLQGICQGPRVPLETIYRTASERYGGRPQLPQLHAELLHQLWSDASGSAAMLRDNLADHPGHLATITALMELEYAAGRGAEVIELGRRLLGGDGERRQSARVKALFLEPQP
jgi:hypothetical protein